jgi:signal peptidase I
LTTRPHRTALREYGEAAVIAVALALGTRGFIVQAFKIPSGSMLPTLQVGDHLLVSKLHYGVPLPLIGGWLVIYRRPQPGEVVVFSNPADRSQDFIKRVIAVAGEMVEIRGKQVLVNGQPRDAPDAYFVDGRDDVMSAPPRDQYGPIVVPPEHLFVLGDNRDRSYDSRFWGFVPLDDVKGKAVFLYWSWDGYDRRVRWERIGDVVACAPLPDRTAPVA